MSKMEPTDCGVKVSEIKSGCVFIVHSAGPERVEQRETEISGRRRNEATPHQSLGVCGSDLQFH